MKRTILALAIAGLTALAFAGPPGPPASGPIDVKVSNTPLPTWLAQPPSMPGLATNPPNHVALGCVFQSSDTDHSKTCYQDWARTGRIWSTFVRMTNDSDTDNCEVTVAISYLGVAGYFLGGFTAPPGASAAFLPYPIVMEHPGGDEYDLTMGIVRTSASQFCSAVAVVQLVPES